MYHCVYQHQFEVTVYAGYCIVNEALSSLLVELKHLIIQIWTMLVHLLEPPSTVTNTTHYMKKVSKILIILLQYFNYLLLIFILTYSCIIITFVYIYYSHTHTWMHACLSITILIASLLLLVKDLINITCLSLTFHDTYFTWHDC